MINLKRLGVAFAVGWIATVAGPAIAQKPAAKPVAEAAAMETTITASWLAGHWSAARADVTTYITGVTATNSSQEYWLDLTFTPLSEGGMEAIVTARQMADETEFVTWKAEVTIANDLVTVIPKGIIGKKEWFTHSPESFQLKRRDNQLVGRTFTKWWVLETSSSLITLQR